MKEFILILEIIVSFFFILNKTELLKNKKRGWLFGLVANTIGVMYFYLIGLHVFCVLDLGLIILCIYGSINYDQNTIIDQTIRMFVGLISFAFMVAVLLMGYKNQFTIYEFISSAGLLISYFLLADKSKITIAWFILFIAHFLALVVGIEKQEWFFSLGQLISCVISVLGVKKNMKARNGFQSIGLFFYLNFSLN